MLQKHLSLQNRQFIERSLNEGCSFKEIARHLEKDNTTISKEVCKHLQRRKVGSNQWLAYNPCAYRHECTEHNLCKKCYESRNKNCRFCVTCHRVCSKFVEEHCAQLCRPPYVCNGCENRSRCTLEKQIYSANYADIIMRDEKTIYNYISYGCLSVRNIDLPRLVRYRMRKKHKSYKVDKKCRIGRTLEDFNLFMKENPDAQIVQMDSVEGIKGGKVLLTVHFVETQFMLAFLREANTARSVTETFDFLYKQLSPETFRELFPVIVTDNGSEFSDPVSIEFDSEGNRRTYVFYCDPSAPNQKGAIENNHTLLRRVIPKGTSFNDFQQADINLMMDHINSYGRKKLNDRSPHQSFSFFHGDDVVGKLNSHSVSPNDIILRPSLLKR